MLTRSEGQDVFTYEWSMPQAVSAESGLQMSPSGGAINSKASHFGGALYAQLLAQGLGYFFPSARLESIGHAPVTRAALVCDCKPDQNEGCWVTFDWLGRRYTLQSPRRSFTQSERRLIHSIGRVLSARYEALLAFANGVQVFSFLSGRWRLTDFELKHRRWLDAVPDGALGNRIFQVALDLAEVRRGALFVILDDARSVTELVSPRDVLDHNESALSSSSVSDSKRSVYYLLRGKEPQDIAPSVLRTLAAIDGGIVLDRKGNLLAFGAIFRYHNDGHVQDGQAPEGARSAAALASSKLGRALKISEDGVIGFFDKGRMVWEM